MNRRVIHVRPSERSKTVALALVSLGMIAALFNVAQAFVGPPVGLRGTYYEGTGWDSRPLRSTLDAAPSTDSVRSAWNGLPPDQFSSTWTGSFVIVTSATYTFGTVSDDASWVYVDGQLVVDNGGRHSSRLATGSIPLRSGVHTIFIKYFQAGGPLSFELSWGRNGSALRVVPSFLLAPGRPNFSRFLLGVTLRLLSTAAQWVLAGALLATLLLVVARLYPHLRRLLVAAQEVRELTRRDVGAAVGVGVVALGVYLRTLAPGLFADIDTPMFQFVGRVLGVPHNPGYPLYVMITYLFSYVPIGSLAYRINLFSAVMGAITVVLVALISRELGCRWIVTCASAIGLAFGSVFWSQATIAEVYTMNTAIIGGVLLALLTWSRTRRPAHFFLATALFSAGLAHHTDIVCFLPGIVIYVVAENPRFVAQLRTIATVTVIITAGLSLYLFILIRSQQPGAYLESQANTLTDLWHVVSGRQFSGRLFSYTFEQIMHQRLPLVLNTVVLPEFTRPAFVLALAGFLFLLCQRPARGVLFLGGCAATFFFALNYAVIDTSVFLIPSILVLWIAAAVGAEYAARLIETWRPVAASVFLAACVSVPIWNLAHNFSRNDLSGATSDESFFVHFFDALPERAFIVREDIVVDRMLSYELLGAHAAKGRQIVLDHPGENDERVRAYAADGFSVFAFQGTAAQLRDDGFDVVPFDFPDVRLPNEHRQFRVFRLAVPR